MEPQEIAKYMQEHYSKTDYLILSLVSCGLVLDKYVEDNEAVDPPVALVAETLNVLRGSLSEQEYSQVVMMIMEIERLGDDANDGSGGA